MYLPNERRGLMMFCTVSSFEIHIQPVRSSLSNALLLGTIIFALLSRSLLPATPQRKEPWPWLSQGWHPIERIASTQDSTEPGGSPFLRVKLFLASPSAHPEQAAAVRTVFETPASEPDPFLAQISQKVSIRRLSNNSTRFLAQWTRFDIIDGGPSAF